MLNFAITSVLYTGVQSGAFLAQTMAIIERTMLHLFTDKAMVECQLLVHQGIKRSWIAPGQAHIIVDHRNQVPP